MRAAAAVLLLLAATGEPARAGTFPYPMDSETLPNGLRVVFIPMDRNGTFAYLTLVRVGSRNEVEPGHTGFAHFFEHMMFRGTDKFPEEAQRKLVSDLGLDSNAFTWDDETVYHFSGPSAALGKVIELEADRFQHLKYTREQFQTEAKAVLGEYNKNDSDPSQRIEEVLLDHAFRKHTYKHTTIGFKADILKMPTQYDYSLKFFKRFYRPDNCTVFVIGDFDRKAAMDKIRAEYGGWSGKAEAPRIAVEPPQTAEKRTAIEWPTETKPRLTVGWHSPEAGTREAVVARVVGPLLFGPTAPLYVDLVLGRHLVEGFDVTYMDPDPRPGHRDPRLLSYTATLKSAGDLPAVAGAVDAAVAGLAEGKVDAARLEEVKQHARYGLLSDLETPIAVGEILTLYVAPTGKLDAIDREFDLLASVTAEDVTAYAKKYLVKSNRTVVETRSRTVADKADAGKATDGGAK